MFFRRKAVGERTYLQIVESRRDGSSVRQHVVATLGRAEEWLDAGKLDTAAAVLSLVSTASSTNSCSPAPA